MTARGPLLSAVLLLTSVFATPALSDNRSGIGDHKTRPKVQQSICAGIRGNGQNLFAHYGALARHVEEYGAITCAAGGSSGSITAFFMESMWANPLTHTCGGSPCRPLERDARYALMLKSVVGLTDSGLFEDADTVGALLAGVSQGNILELLNGPLPQEGVDAFIRLLRDLGPLINQEAIELLLTSPDPVFHAKDIIDGLQKGIQFIVDDPRVFLRTSVVNFDQFATLLGVYGSFYAGYGPRDRRNFKRWLRRCANRSVGLTWVETARLSGANGATCGENLTDLFNEYRERFAEQGGRNRADDRVGRYFPVFGVTGVLKGRAIKQWEEARAAWINATPIPFEPNFDDIGVGYWGKQSELRRMKRRLNRKFKDLVSRQFTPLGSASWREVLSSSPAEPGFSPAVPLSSGFVSVGGWADPLRVQPLFVLTEESVVAINRLGGVGGFTEAVTRLLNASDQDIRDLYSTVDPSSSFFVGLDVATGVWCTDWDGQMSDPNLLFNDAYTSPLITTSSRLLEPRFGYTNVGQFSIGGCTPGIAVGGN
ncbi:MAG: hypothetical protein AAF438_11725 [Pseudomonadota bacterium]